MPVSLAIFSPSDGFCLIWRTMSDSGLQLPFEGAFDLAGEELTFMAPPATEINVPSLTPTRINAHGGRSLGGLVELTTLRVLPELRRQRRQIAGVHITTSPSARAANAASSAFCFSLKGGRLARSTSCLTVFLLITSPFFPVGYSGRDNPDDLGLELGLHFCHRRHRIGYVRLLCCCLAVRWCASRSDPGFFITFFKGWKSDIQID